MSHIRPLPAAPRRARGATLLMALVLLLVLLLFALSAVNSTVLGTRMLGNAQATVQAEAALAVAIEQTISRRHPSSVDCTAWRDSPSTR